jgi:spore germination cell wall hydrolase CwlJ-like protein
MQGSERTKIGPVLMAAAAACGLGACNTSNPVLTTGSIAGRAPPMVVSDAERDCAVVGQPGQFAAGVLTKPMQEKDLQKVADAADAVLAGERHPQVGKAMYFHTAGRHYPYPNMHYVAVAGGNAFYEKRDARAAKSGSRAENKPDTAAPASIPTFAAASMAAAQ